MKRLPLSLLSIATTVFFVGSGYLGLNASPSSEAPDAMIAMLSAVEKQAEYRRDSASRVRLEHADLLSFDASLQPDIQRLTGNVRFRHGNATMTCDSAYLNDVTQTFEAFGQVHMIQGDTVHLYARYLHYDGSTRLARLRQEVKLENTTTTVFTDSLDYDRVADMAYYFDGGTVVDAQNTLNSDYGQYYPRTHDAEFRYNVTLTNDSTEMTTEHLFYNTASRVGRYEGTSEIRSDSGLILSTRGVYDLDKNVGILLDRSEVYSGDRVLIGDSIYYDGTTRFGEAFGQMELHDTLQRASLYGDYGYFESERNYAFATSRAYAVDYSQADTLYVGADTLELISFEREMEPDSLGNLPTDSLERHLRGYHHVRVYRLDAQAIADSMAYSSVDSVLRLYGRPVMWYEQRQLTGDTTHLHFRNQKLDFADVLGNTFGIEQMIDEPTYFNQLRGNHIRAYIQDSTIRQIDVTGGVVESIHYMKEEKEPEYTGMNRMTSSAMHATLDSGKLKKVFWLGEVKAKVYPISMSRSESVNRLEGFAWQTELRPKQPSDVVSTDSTATNYTLASLKRFSGARAALTVYEPHDVARAEKRRLADSIAAERAAIPDTHDYKYILRPQGELPVPEDTVAKLLSLSWLYNHSSAPDVPAHSSTRISTGIPVKKLSDEELNALETSSLNVVK